MAFVPVIPIRPSGVSLTSRRGPELRTTRYVTSPVAKAPPRMALSDDVRSALTKVCVAASVVALSASIVVAPPAEAALFNARGERPENLGVQYGRFLGACPPTRNCISSSANVYDSHYVPAWTYNNEEVQKPKKDMKEAITDITQVLNEYPRATIIESKAVTSEYGTGHYIYAEFESKLVGFVDDVEFYFQPDKASVEYRSASRLGESDFDVNRNRIRDIRKALQNLDTRWASLGF